MTIIENDENPLVEEFTDEHIYSSNSPSNSKHSKKNSVNSRNFRQEELDYEISLS